MAGLLNDRVCLVTGAGGGIGKATVEKFAWEGAIVYANDKPGIAMDAWAREISETRHTAVIPLYADVTDHDGVKKAFLRIRQECKKLDVLVNNAAVVSYEPLGMVSNEHLKNMFAVNVFAVIELIQYASRMMTHQKSGSIINMSSLVGVNGAAGQAVYAASKGALIALTKSLAKELAPKNVRVNAVAPGMVNTERFRAEMESRFAGMASAIGMGRLGEPTEIADVCVFLASDMSSYMTGQVVGVDGCAIF